MSIGSSTPPAAWEIGTEVLSFTTAPLSVNDFVRYQGASGDLNPIHHDPEFAHRSGYPSVFAVGMMAAGILATALADEYGPGNVRRFKVRWRRLAWPGDALSYRMFVSGLSESDGERLVTMEGSVTRQNGEVHLQAWATFAAKERCGGPGSVS